MSKNLDLVVDPETCGRKVEGECDKVCDRERELYCENYKPLSVYNKPVRQGRFSIYYLEMWGFR